MKGRFVSYLRVSTQKQGINGLGIDAQKKAIENYLNGDHWEMIKEFIEVESGKRTDNRPMLKEAIDCCKRTGAKLLIAKLDRLSRNVAFISNLMESGVEFVAVDMPQANRLTIHILAAMAEYEREMISKRTKDALQAAKARGVQLGSPKGLSAEAAVNGRNVSVQKRKTRADEYAKRIYPIIKALLDSGLSFNAIARKMNEEKELTPRGKGTWTPTTIKNILKRIN